MPDDTTPGTPQAGNLGNPPTQAVTTPTPDAQAADGTEQISLDEAKKLRKEAQALRTRLKGFEDKEASDAALKLSETERLQKQYSDLKATHDETVRKMQESIVRSEVKSTAVKLGIIDPDAAVKLLDWSELEYDDDGIPKNAEKVLQTLLKSKTYLAGPSQPATPKLPAMNPGRSSIQQPGALPPGQIPRMADIFKRPS